MAHYEVVGNVDPFLLVKLQHHEQIYCESNAMVTMDATLELKGKMQGGLLSSLARRFTQGESFFQQEISATNGPGETLLAPTLPGDIMILDIGPRQYRLNDEAFMAADKTVQITTRRQGIGQALFGGSGGFFIMETAGTGKLAISGFGGLFNLDVTPGNDMIVDNSHVVAWDTSLRHELSTTTAKTGFLSGLLNSVTSGEGVVQRFSGQGQVVVCSRNRGGFLSWIAAKTARSS
jgi:uncharacterized protein (TIGR00266 family)